jgi:hypothetical protein
LAFCARLQDVVQRDDGVAKEPPDVDGLGWALLVFEVDQAHLGSTALCEIDPAVTDRLEAWATTLRVVGQIEIVATHEQ